MCSLGTLIVSMCRCWMLVSFLPRIRWFDIVIYALVMLIPIGPASIVLFMKRLFIWSSLCRVWNSTVGMLGATEPCLLLKLVSMVDWPRSRLDFPGVSTLVINALPPAPGNRVEATACKSAPIELMSLPFLKNFLEVTPSLRVGLT